MLIGSSHSILSLVKCFDVLVLTKIAKLVKIGEFFVSQYRVYISKYWISLRSAKKYWISLRSAKNPPFEKIRNRLESAIFHSASWPKGYGRTPD